MDTNTRSYISRFSGLLLFLLTLLVVGILVVLTIRAARDNDTASNTVNTVASTGDSVQGEDFIIDGGATIDGELDSIAAEGEDESEDEDSLTPTLGVVETGDEENSVDVRDDSEGDSDDAAAVAGSEDDRTEDSEEANSDGLPTTVASAGGDELPNTGARESLLIGVFVSAMLYAFAASRKDLIESLK